MRPHAHGEAATHAPRRVGIDARNLALRSGTGVATYGAVLADTLAGLGLQPELVGPGRLLPRPLRWLRGAWPGSMRAHRQADGRHTAPDPFRVAQVHLDVWRRPLLLGSAHPPEVMHWTSPLPLWFASCPNLVTIHDLIPLLHPGLVATEPARLRRLLIWIVRHAAHVLTVSEATRQDVITHLGVDPGRVTNTWQAVDVAGADAAPPPGLTPGGYWLHVGAVEPRKNLVRLVAAWRAAGSATPLVVAGPDGWRAAEQLSGAGDVVRVPWVARPQLLALIRDARAVLMPSLAEGFGLPVAEAMALGTPVLTSSRGALAEVAGGAAATVDPEDVQALAEALRALDTDAALRGRLRAAGQVRTALFTKTAYAARLAPLYPCPTNDPGRFN